MAYTNPSVVLIFVGSVSARLANGSEVSNHTLEHLWVVKMERSHYKATRASEHTLSPMASLLLLFHAQTFSNDIKVHCSFDYAQQVHYPSDPLQIYFLTPRKCTVFGVNCEALPRQVNFLTDEAGDCGKGANAVVSRLDFFFDHHGFGEKDVFLHADNCTGQNKNNCMVQYLVWRVMTKRHTNITLSFLLVESSRCFDPFKRLYRWTKHRRS